MSRSFGDRKPRDFSAFQRDFWAWSTWLFSMINVTFQHFKLLWYHHFFSSRIVHVLRSYGTTDVITAGCKTHLPISKSQHTLAILTQVNTKERSEVIKRLGAALSSTPSNKFLQLQREYLASFHKRTAPSFKVPGRKTGGVLPATCYVDPISQLCGAYTTWIDIGYKIQHLTLLLNATSQGYMACGCISQYWGLFLGLPGATSGTGYLWCFLFCFALCTAMKLLPTLRQQHD